MKKIKKFRGSQDYKRSISEELDRRLQGKIKEVFREKEMDTNIDMEDLKMWYYQYGKFDIFQKKRVNWVILYTRTLLYTFLFIISWHSIIITNQPTVNFPFAFMLNLNLLN